METVYLVFVLTAIVLISWKLPQIVSSRALRKMDQIYLELEESQSHSLTGHWNVLEEMFRHISLKILSIYRLSMVFAVLGFFIMVPILATPDVWFLMSYLYGPSVLLFATAIALLAANRPMERRALSFLDSLQKGVYYQDQAIAILERAIADGLVVEEDGFYFHTSND